MRKLIKYYSIEYGAPLFSIPKFTNSEIVEVNSEKELQKYIESKKDEYGRFFKKKKSFGFDYISTNGGIKVENYKSPKIKKI